MRLEGALQFSWPTPNTAYREGLATFPHSKEIRAALEEEQRRRARLQDDLSGEGE